MDALVRQFYHCATTFMYSVAIDIKNLMHSSSNRISRGEPQQQSNVQFFSSHLMTIMKDNSIEAASKCIQNININVFEKKLLFFPINADSHWSLGVVVNPGLIENSFDNDSDPNEEHTL